MSIIMISNLQIRRSQILCIILLFCLVGTSSHADGELYQIHRTYSQTQTVEWIDNDHFAIGRWDGTMTLFSLPAHVNDTSPDIFQALISPSGQGIEMMMMLPTGELGVSNNDSTISLYRQANNSYHFAGFAPYNPDAGIFNSGCEVTVGSQTWFVSGHANGSVIRWKVEEGEMIPDLLIDIRSDDPIKSPYRIKNVRGIVYWYDGIIITGDEDGDLCMIDIVAGKIIQRTRYNPDAQRGINGLAILNDSLLVTNCVVGTGEKNLWLYHLDDTGFMLQDSRYLVSSPEIPDIFSDSVSLLQENDTTHFYVGTGEGAIWHGIIEDTSIRPLEIIITGKLGVAPIFEWNHNNSHVVAADYDIRVFERR